MASNFAEILTTLGANEVELVQESPRWNLWKAFYRTPAGTMVAHYLYLLHRCPLQEATSENKVRWKSEAGRNGFTLVTAPRSPLAQNIAQTRVAFGAANAVTSKQLLLDNFVKEFKWRDIETVDPFIEPDLQLRTGETVPKAVSYLRSWLGGVVDLTPATSIGVLVAEGGVGKTTVSRILCKKLHVPEFKTIPLLVESDQWRDLLHTNLTMNSIWDLAISRRFEHAGRLLANNTALKVLIKEGLFPVIFDGFDELCVVSGTAFRPKEVIAELGDLAESDDGPAQARIMLTVRETFWQSIEEEIDQDRVTVFKLKGFDQDQRKRFFEARLSDQTERDAALRISKQIGGGIYGGLAKGDAPESETNRARLSGVPFILDLIAHYVHDEKDLDGTKKGEINPYQTDPFAVLLEDVCRRENRRQSLGIDPQQQFLLFEELFREFPERIPSEELGFYLEALCGVTDPLVVQRFMNHVFLVRVGKDQVAPRYEVLRIYFLARFLAQSLASTTARTDRNKIAKLLAKNSTGKTQVIDWLVDQLREKRDSLPIAVRHAIEIIDDASNRDVRKPSSMALFHILVKLIDAHDKAERVRTLASLYGGSDSKDRFSRVTMTGVVKSFDFSNVTFAGCLFVDCEFRNCNFSSGTKFLNCTFEGSLEFQACGGASDVQVADSSYSREAEFAFDSVRRRSTRADVLRNFAEDAMARALKKFRADYGFKSLRYDHRRGGFRTGNPYNDRVWDVLLSARILERHHISSVEEGGLNIRDDKEVRREVASFLDNGTLGKRLRAVADDLIG